MTRSLARHSYLDILRAALSAHQYRFARQAALEWLSTYPGDLSASLYYGRALTGEQRLPQAKLVLQGLCRADPEFVEALEMLLNAETDPDGASGRLALVRYQALTGRSPGRSTLPAWGKKLWSARQALATGDLALAGKIIGECLSEAGEEPLVGVTHLSYLAASAQVELGDRRQLALSYHQRWPDCVACVLWLAHWSLEIGETDYAVALLHQAVSRDTGGQVAQRLWGKDHPYRVLWPEGLEHSLSMPIPADVTVWLGLNRLPSGEAVQEQEQAVDVLQVIDQATSSAAGQSPVEEPVELAPVDDFAAKYGIEAGEGSQPDPDQAAAAERAVLQAAGLEWAIAETDVNDESEPAPVVAVAAVETRELLETPEPVEKSAAVHLAAVAATVALADPEPDRSNGRKDNGSKPLLPDDPDLVSVSQAFDRMAGRLKAPAAGRQDGRYPVYVIFSVRSRLESVYGKRIADLLVGEMLALAEIVGQRKGWGARLFMPDDPACLTQLDKPPLRTIDPWELKLALVDLDTSLARRGERIGAVLIIGGPEIVPFHRLPNPVDDQDDDVPTDNPYATRDENYFIPEWPVGRLPGGMGNDAHVILEALNRIRGAHEISLPRPSLIKRLLGWLRQLLIRPAGSTLQNTSERSQYPAPRRSKGRKMSAFGYTAAIWKQAASLVFRPIGKPAGLSVSPPFGIDGAAPEAEDDDAAGKIPALRGRLAYFNLHGLVDAPEWYGQRDPLSAGADPDYPVALRPKDILVHAKGNNAKNGRAEIPQIVFSEACYGLHIEGRDVQGAISLSFLQAGSLAVIGSTCMAYGSIGAPLAAADLLGHTFWRYMNEGYPAGEALIQAKIQLALVMSQQQGYLDGEDQKTLISFILYGDPLALPVTSEKAPKCPRYQPGALTAVPIVCERSVASDVTAPLPTEVIASVRRVVAHHLPGMSDARLTLAHPHSSCNGEGHCCPASQLQRSADPQKEPAARPAQPKSVRNKSKNASEDACNLVTLTKQVTLPSGIHPRVARLTLDQRGKLVKLVISR
jgi:hypothetical protein